MEKIYEMIEDALRQCDFDVKKIKALATYLELEEEVKWRVPANLRDYFDYQSYAEDAYSDIYDIWDIKASDTINIDGTIYEVIQINK